MPATSRELIDAFLAAKRLAFVGVSREKRHFSRMLFREMLGRGYELIPVHPEAAEIEGIKACRTVLEIDPPPAGALLMNPPGESAEIVGQCARAGIGMVWLYRGVALGSVTPEALAAAGQHGLRVVAGECPFMFLEGAGLIHALHRGFRRLTGTLPPAPPRA